MRWAARRAARHAGIFCLGLGLSVPAAADISLEYQVKAAYLTKFMPFITWPDSAFPAPGAPVTICVLGDGPFGAKLEQAAALAKSGDRAIQVRHVAGPDPGCQMMFLGTGAEGMVDALRGKPVLTVTDSGLKTHGVISFVIADNHVRFDIDDAAAQQDGLTISSKLLGLAHAVKRGMP
ncbi:MAG TPA: YfiR family protein [Rhizomicrobium sp.]|nr:YfiR family protein [Rhizomicrobium sp.]